MRRYLLTILSFATAGALFACGSDSAPPEPVQSSEKVAGIDARAELADAYANVLNQPDSYEFNRPVPFRPTGHYSYALADITGDELPELLLRADVTHQFAPVTVFSKPEGGELFNTHDVLKTGTDSAAGTRAFIAASGSGNGLYQITAQDGDANYTVEHLILQDQKLIPGNDSNTRSVQDVYDEEHIRLPWFPTSDRSPLELLRSASPSGTKDSATTSAKPSQAPEQTPPQARETIVEECGGTGPFLVATGTTATSCVFAKAVAQAVPYPSDSPTFTVEAESPITLKTYTMSCVASEAETVCIGGNNAKAVLWPVPPSEAEFIYERYENSYEGVVVLKTPEEAAFGGPLPYALEPGSEYVVLQLDSPQPFTGYGGPDLITQFEDFLGLGQLEISKYGSMDTSIPWRQYVGKRIRLYLNDKEIVYPTDVSMPIGIPRLSFLPDYLVEVVDDPPLPMFLASG